MERVAKYEEMCRQLQEANQAEIDVPDVIDVSPDAQANDSADRAEEYLVATGGDHANDGNFVITDFLLPNSTIDAFLKISPAIEVLDDDNV